MPQRRELEARGQTLAVAFVRLAIDHQADPLRTPSSRTSTCERRAVSTAPWSEGSSPVTGSTAPKDF